MGAATPEELKHHDVSSQPHLVTSHGAMVVFRMLHRSLQSLHWRLQKRLRMIRSHRTQGFQSPPMCLPVCNSCGQVGLNLTAPAFSGAYRRSLAESSAKTISRIDAFWLQSQSQVPMPNFSPNSFSYRGSYFKLGAEGSQNFVDWLRGGLSHRESLGVSFGVCRGQGSQIQDRAVIEAVSWCVYRGQGFADLREGCHRGCHERGHLMPVYACTGGDSGWDSRYWYDIIFHICLVIFYICILVCFLPRNISMEEDVSCESAWDKLQNIADTFPRYLGSMLV